MSKGIAPCLSLTVTPGSHRLTTEWSVEDKEEAAREQRRRERDRQLQAQDQEEGSHSPELPEQEAL
jgi:lymphocyte-specific protein 1